MNRSRRNYVIYLLMILLFAAGMVGLTRLGHGFDSIAPAHTVTDRSPVGLWYEMMSSNVAHPLSLLLLQVIAILIAVRIFSYLFKYLGQPGVIGEIVAGIVLGPSLLGHFFPQTFAMLFAPESLVPLNVVSQIGLVLFMFVVGMELDTGVLRRKASETLVISHASIVVPFLLGMGMAYAVYPEFGAGHSTFMPFALFIAISVSITAFPVLARIVQERNLHKSPMGMLAIASAANNDVTAWCLLAAVIAVARAGDVTSALFTLLMLVLYVLCMFYLVKPFLRKLGEAYNRQETVSKTLVGFIFLVLICSAYVTEILGVHALFGAFVAGVVMPSNVSFRRVMTEKMEDIALVFFLPLFFVFTGLRTEIGVLNSPHLWMLCGLFVLLSIVGKLFGASLAARAVGESWRDSLSIGVLMNARGLMELIVLNIGYEMGIIPDSLFVIFVIMALVTTFMTTPLLMLIQRFGHRKCRENRHKSGHEGPRILISFANPESGPLFLQLSRWLYGDRLKRGATITAIHYTIGTETNPLNVTDYARESFAPLEQTAQQMGLTVETRYRVTDHYTEDLCALASNERYDLVLTGVGPNFMRAYFDTPRWSLRFDERRVGSLLSKSGRWLPPGLIQDKIRVLFQNMRPLLGVFVNRDLQQVHRVCAILRDSRDRTLLPLIEGVAQRVQVQLNAAGDQMPFLSEADDHSLARLSVGNSQLPLSTRIKECDLVLVSYSAWQYIVRNERPLLRQMPSFVILKPRSNEV